QARIYRAWSVERYGRPDLERLQLLAQVLGGSKSSRLDRRLVFEDKLADKVSAYVLPFELASTFYVTADVRQGVDPAQVEKVLDEEIARLLAEGPTAAELQQAQAMVKASVVRGVERIGGFGGKADALAECAVYTGNPGCFRDSLEVFSSATVEDVRKAGRTWLGEGSHTLVVEPGERQVLAEEPSPTPAPFNLPKPDRKDRTVRTDVDRSKGVPMPERCPGLKGAALMRAALGNGTQVARARRGAGRVVQFSSEFEGGLAADHGRKLGTSRFTRSMLDEGAGDLDAIGFANRVESLG